MIWYILTKCALPRIVSRRAARAIALLRRCWLFFRVVFCQAKSEEPPDSRANRALAALS